LISAAPGIITDFFHDQDKLDFSAIDANTSFIKGVFLSTAHQQRLSCRRLPKFCSPAPFSALNNCRWDGRAHLGRMTKDDYRAILEALGLSQVAAAKVLGIADRTSRAYALGERPVPQPVVLVLRLLMEKQRKKRRVRERQEKQWRVVASSVTHPEFAGGAFPDPARGDQEVRARED
jgi:hypothetical protein